MSKVTVLKSEEEIAKRCVELGQEITKAYEGKSIYVISVLTGAVFFACELTKRIDRPMILDFVTASSYENTTESSGDVKVQLNLKHDIAGKDVLIIEDIIDTGRTLDKLKTIILEKHPASLKICTMLDKPARREKGFEVDVDFVGFQIENKFVVGYGLDYTDETMRNLPFIGTVEFD